MKFSPIVIVAIVIASGLVVYTVAVSCGDSDLYTLTGDRWSAFPVSYSIDAPPDFVQSIRNGFATWEREEHPVGQMFTETSGPAQIQVRFAPLDGKGGTLGESRISSVGGRTVGVEIVLDSAEDWAVYSVELCFPQGVSIDVESVAVHEIGHAIGLDHPPSDHALTMDAKYAPGETHQRSLASGDRLGLATLYP